MGQVNRPLTATTIKHLMMNIWKEEKKLVEAAHGMETNNCATMPTHSALFHQPIFKHLCDVPLVPINMIIYLSLVNELYDVETHTRSFRKWLKFIRYRIFCFLFSSVAVVVIVLVCAAQQITLLECITNSDKNRFVSSSTQLCSTLFQPSHSSTHREAK